MILSEDAVPVRWARPDLFYYRDIIITLRLIKYYTTYTILIYGTIRVNRAGEQINNILNLTEHK